MLLDRRHATFRQAADRERFLLSVPPEAVSLPTGLHGKLISPGGSSFNLSHCSYLVVLAGDGSTSVKGAAESIRVVAVPSGYRAAVAMAPARRGAVPPAPARRWDR